KKDIVWLACVSSRADCQGSLSLLSMLSLPSEEESYRLWSAVKLASAAPRFRWLPIISVLPSMMEVSQQSSSKLAVAVLADTEVDSDVTFPAGPSSKFWLLVDEGARGSRVKDVP